MEPGAISFAVLAYDGIEPIDIGATYGVLSMARRVAPFLRFFAVSKTGRELTMAGGLRLVPDYSFASSPAADVIIVLGGPGWQEASVDAEVLEFIRTFHENNGIVAAVCTGGMIVGAAGLLAGRVATTKRETAGGEKRPLDLLAERHRDVSVIEARIVDTGSVLTGGGVSLGIDMTLYLLQRFFGNAVAAETARILEYRNAWMANASMLPDFIEPHFSS
jgi:transcriptional regulator GlxA family with amidase domain